jgi:tetratricopeptide (TPR) repeat protein
MVMTKDELFQGLRKWPTAERKTEFIENALKSNIPVDVKIAALIARAELYIGKRWFHLAAHDYCYAADLATVFREKTELYFKGALMYVHADDYFTADDNFRKALVLSSTSERPKLLEKIPVLYFEHALSYEQNQQQAKAIVAFSKTLTLPNLSHSKRLEVYEKLIVLYEKVGKPRDANVIKAQRDNMLGALNEAERQHEENKRAAEKAKRERLDIDQLY